jgi:hypothetical protein
MIWGWSRSSPTCSSNRQVGGWLANAIGAIGAIGRWGASQSKEPERRGDYARLFPLAVRRCWGGLAAKSRSKARSARRGGRRQLAAHGSGGSPWHGFVTDGFATDKIVFRV